MNKDIKMEKQAQRPYCLLNFNQAEPAYEKQIKSTTTLYQHLDELFHEPELASQAEFAKKVAECREDDKRVIWNAGCTYAMPLAVLGEDEFFIRVVTEPELMRELCERYAIRKADAIVQTLQVMQIRPEVLLFSDPFGKSGLPPLRPAVFRTLLKSAQQFLVRCIKRAYPEIKIWYRCCAASYSLAADFAEIGFDAWIPSGKTESFAQELEDCRQFIQDELELLSVTEGQWDSLKKGTTTCV